jgi:hypothetical protein
MMIAMTAKDKAFLSMAEIMASLSPCSKADYVEVLIVLEIDVK